MSQYEFADSVQIDASPQAVYDIVSDVTRVAEWSPVCVGAEWEPPATGPEVGAWFAGHNRSEGREWSTRSQVVEAAPGEAFAWEVNGGLVAWRYDLTPVDGGTRALESWHLRPEGVQVFRDKYGDQADDVMGQRGREARSGIPASLAVIKRLAENDGRD